LPLSEEAISTISGIVGIENTLTEEAECWVYGYDNSRNHRVPDIVIFPGDESQIAAVCQYCSENRIPVTARGRGTSTTGSSIPVAAGLVISFEKMNRIKKTDPANRVMVVEPGVTNTEVQIEAAKSGFFWGPDPTSSNYCTVGGNIATNAGGPHAVKYGTTRDHVLGLRAVTATGEAIKTGSYTTKSSVGYDLTRLVIGSEGTLAVVTEATLKLTPLPETRSTIKATFENTQSAADTVSRIMAQPVTPCALEFMDAAAIKIVREFSTIPISENIGALLMIEIDGTRSIISESVGFIKKAAECSGLLGFEIADNDEDTGNLWLMRKSLSPALRKLAPNKINEDVVVPVSNIPALINGLESLSAEFNIPIVNFGHAGNGNIHVNLLYDSQDDQQANAARPCLHKVFELVMSLNGSISGEHGIGFEKKEYISHEIQDPTLRLMWKIKQQFDPNGILNPGKIFPDTMAQTEIR